MFGDVSCYSVLGVVREFCVRYRGSIYQFLDIVNEEIVLV